MVLKWTIFIFPDTYLAHSVPLLASSLSRALKDGFNNWLIPWLLRRPFSWFIKVFQSLTLVSFKNQYTKEYKVGHRARKRDQNARASFVLIVGDRWSLQRGSTVNFHFCVKRWSPLLILGCRSTINAERINSQLSLSCEKAIASVDPWRGIDAPPRHSVRSTGWPLVLLNVVLFVSLNVSLCVICKEKNYFFINAPRVC